MPSRRGFDGPTTGSSAVPFGNSGSSTVAAACAAGLIDMSTLPPPLRTVSRNVAAIGAGRWQRRHGSSPDAPFRAIVTEKRPHLLAARRRARSGPVAVLTRARSRFKNEARIAAVDARGRGQTNMRIKRLLIANRGEVAIRIARTAAELGMTSVAIYSEDDRRALHTRLADEAVALQGSGPAAYLDAAHIVARATAAGCEAVHPGYGFLSENAGFARECEEGGLIFVGPRAATLDLFGDKAAARRFAETCGVPVIDGTAGDDAGRGARVPRRARAGRRGDGEGACGGWRARDARGERSRSARYGLRAVPRGGVAGVRQRLAVRGAAVSAGAPCGGADRR